MNRTILLALITGSTITFQAMADDSPQWGQALTRNMVSPEKNLWQL